MLNPRPTDIYDVGSRGGQGARLQPKHFVHTVVLFPAFNYRETRNSMKDYLQQGNFRDKTQWSCERRVQNKSFGTIDLIPSYDEESDNP